MGKTKDTSKKPASQAGKEPSKNENARTTSGEGRAPARTAAKALTAIAVGIGGILSLTRRRARTSKPTSEPHAPEHPHAQIEEQNTAGADDAPRPSPSPVPPPLASPSRFNHDAIALRAYYLSEERRAAGLPDDPRRDWLDAERELLGKTSVKNIT